MNMSPLLALGADFEPEMASKRNGETQRLTVNPFNTIREVPMKCPGRTSCALISTPTSMRQDKQFQIVFNIIYSMVFYSILIRSFHEVLPIL